MDYGQLKAGTVLYLDCNFTHPPKAKYILLISISSNHYFCINSRPNNYIQHRPYLYQSQVRITSASHAFLHHDSYIDCSEFVMPTDVAEQIDKNGARVKGMVTSEVALQIISAVSQSETLTPIEIDLVITALNASYPSLSD